MLQLAPDKTRAVQRLAKLQQTYPLPPGYVLDEPLLEQAEVGELELSMVGLVASGADGSRVTGAAADVQGFPVDRAFFELLERLSIMSVRAADSELVVRSAAGLKRATCSAHQVFPPDAEPGLLRKSLSNGVALHESWPEACGAAVCELVERDRVLRSFSGEFAPTAIVLKDAVLMQALRSHYEVAAYRLEPPTVACRYAAIAVFLFPLRSSDPLAYGFAAALDLEHAMRDATREALQRLAFLWGEALPNSPPEPAPTPDYHQDYYLYAPHQHLLRDWLAGRTVQSTTEIAPMFDGEAPCFVDLTPPGLHGLVAVAKAESARTSDLRFGRDPKSSWPAHPVA